MSTQIYPIDPLSAALEPLAWPVPIKYQTGASGGTLILCRNLSLGVGRTATLMVAGSLTAAIDALDERPQYRQIRTEPGNDLL